MTDVLDETELAYRLANTRPPHGLRPREFEAFLLHVFDGLDYDACAEHMKCKESTVRAYVSDAHAKIRTAVAAMDMEQKEGRPRTKIDIERSGEVIAAENTTMSEAFRRLQRKMLIGR